MEETIGYEALFSSREWNAMLTDDWSLLDDEADLEFSGSSCGEEDEVAHQVRAYQRGTAFEAECEACGRIGAADSIEQAEAIARLHEAFVATLVESWSVER
ncbi:MAG: hypothetical protein H0V97_09170 [Actinobacteria bacterium]|nr:hypothetical protein [Actinomycetota bacterium]